MSSHAVHGGLVFWDYLIVAGYLVWMIGIGLYYSGRQKDTSEYFLGGRSMHWLLVGLSTMATLISTITYLTTPGELIANGFGFLWSMVSVYVAFFIIAYLFIPRVMSYKGLVSGYQLLEKQFGEGIRRVAAGLFILTRIAWTGLVVYTCSRAASQMIGVPLPWVIISIGLITVSYTAIGGIRAVIIADVTQSFILFGGALLVVVFAMVSAHSLTGWWPNFGDPHLKAALDWPHNPWFSFDPTVRITVLGIILMYVVMWVCMAGADQMAIQRYLSTKDIKAARKSFLTNAVANSLVTTALALCGVALLGFFLHNPSVIPSADELLLNKPSVLAEVRQALPAMEPFQRGMFTLKKGADDVFPWFIAHILPAGISGVLIAALLSAAMSSVSSGVNSIATVLMVDFKRLFAAGIEEESRKVARAKVIGLVVGVVAIAVSLLQNLIQGNFMEVAQKINGFFTAPLAALFIMAFFVRRVNRQGAWASVIAGFVVGVLISYSGEIRAFLGGDKTGLSFMFILPVSLLVAVVTGYVVSLFYPKTDEEPAM
jgi:SSS family solute:Na+ symporter